jgi:hypothetical protein
VSDPCELDLEPKPDCPSWFQLVIDKNIKKLPRRETDGAIIVRCRDTSHVKAPVFKLNASECDPILLKR